MTIVESETIESDIVEKSQYQRPTFDRESKYEKLMLHTRYYYTVSRDTNIIVLVTMVSWSWWDLWTETID